MRTALLALGVLSAAMVQPVLAQTSGDPALAELNGQATEASQSERDVPKMAMGHFPPSGPPAAMHPGPDRMARGPGLQGLSPELALAARLAMLETRIGIRAEQLDAWRDYTGALQQLLSPPLEQGPGGPGERRPENPQVERKGTRDPFAFEEGLATDFAKRAAAADRLKAAIAALRTALTPEQLDILASTDRPGGPAHGPGGGGPSENAAGPGGSPRGKPPLQRVPPAEGQP